MSSIFTIWPEQETSIPSSQAPLDPPTNVQGGTASPSEDKDPSMMSVDSYNTAHGSNISIAAAIVGSIADRSTVHGLPHTSEPSTSLLFHRFTMIKAKLGSYASNGSTSAKRHSASIAWER